MGNFSRPIFEDSFYPSQNHIYDTYAGVKGRYIYPSQNRGLENFRGIFKGTISLCHRIQGFDYYISCNVSRIVYISAMITVSILSEYLDSRTLYVISFKIRASMPISVFMRAIFLSLGRKGAKAV